MTHASKRATALQADLKRLLGAEAVLSENISAYLQDATEDRGVRGYTDTVVAPSRPEDVAKLIAWCYRNEVSLTPRGGGTGFAGGAVPLQGGVVVSSERLRTIRRFDREHWRIYIEAGLRTSEVHRITRENGLYFPPDPGAAEQSHIGGNIACNAGGPHAFKYGVTGAWVTGLEVAVPPGNLLQLGYGLSKDVAGLDLKSLFVGSEGTLGFITAAWLRLVPAPEVALPVVAVYPDVPSGCEAIAQVYANGIQAAALEYLDNATVAVVGASFPTDPLAAGFMVIAEADGSPAEAEATRESLIDVLAAGAGWIDAPTGRREIAALWRWRHGVSIAIASWLNGKISEDIVVPIDRLGEAIEATLAIGAAHGLETCSWGHAGDGNLHSTFMIDRDDCDSLRRAGSACDDLFALAIALGGSISGEHGVGLVKQRYLEQQLGPIALNRMRAVRSAFDPKGLMNPGKKITVSPEMHDAHCI